ncbi:hypothetical protein GVAV_000495 [Gurleya vavrai]
MIKKTIYHKPSTYILKIENDALKIRTKSAPPTFPENASSKSIELVLPDGKVLTKEMIEAMNFSESESEEECKRDYFKENAILKPTEKLKNSFEKVKPLPIKKIEQEIVVEKKEYIENNDFSTDSEEFEDKKNEEIYVFTPQVKKSTKQIKQYSLKDIFECEPKEIELNFDRSILRKKDQSTNKFRLEMNRIAWSNADEVIKQVKYMKVTKAEMNNLAEILYEKSITEETFVVLYCYVLNQLKDFFYLGELREKEKEWNERIMKESKVSDGKINHEIEKEDVYLNRSAFFNRVLKLCQETILERKDWKLIEDGINLSKLTFEERSILSEQKEEGEIQRNVIKQRILGTVRFVSILFVNKIIPSVIMKGMIKSIILNKSNLKDEDYEILCLIIKNAGLEIFNEIRKYFSEIKSLLENGIKLLGVNMIKFLVLDTIDEMKKIEDGKGKESEFKDERTVKKDEFKREDFGKKLESKEISKPRDSFFVKKFDYVPLGGDVEIKNSKRKGREFNMLKRPETTTIRKDDIENKLDSVDGKKSNFNIKENKLENVDGKKSNSNSKENIDEKKSNSDIKENADEKKIFASLKENKSEIMDEKKIHVVEETKKNNYTENVYAESKKKFFCENLSVDQIKYTKNYIDEIPAFSDEDFEMVFEEIKNDFTEKKISKGDFAVSFLFNYVRILKNHEIIKDFFTESIKVLKIDKKELENAVLYVNERLNDIIFDFPRCKLLFDEIVIFWRTKVFITIDCLNKFVEKKEIEKYGKNLLSDPNNFLALDRLFEDLKSFYEKNENDLSEETKKNWIDKII